MRFFCVETVNLSQQNIANNLEAKSNDNLPSDYKEQTILARDADGRIFTVKFRTTDLSYQSVKYEEFVETWKNSKHIFSY